MRYLTFDEEDKLFEKLQGQEWAQRIVTMAINTGMRQGEIFDLAWFDVDLPRGVIHIRVSKNGKDRFVPINQTVRAMLEGLPHTYEHVFPSPRTKGRLIDVKRRFDLAKCDAGIKISAFMTCVTTAATRMVAAERMLSRLRQSSAGLTSEWLCATPTPPMRPSAERLKIWCVRSPSDESVTEKCKVAALP